jgi:hypothetical protein
MHVGGDEHGELEAVLGFSSYVLGRHVDRLARISGKTLRGSSDVLCTIMRESISARGSISGAAPFGALRRSGAVRSSSTAR